MNVLMVHNFYQSHLTGGEDLVHQHELNALKAQLGDGHVFEYKVSNDDMSLAGLLFGLWFSRKHYRAIKTLCKTHKIDIVHVHNFFPLLTPSVFCAAKKAGSKVVHTLHNYRWWCLSGTLFYQNQACHRCVQKKSRLPGILRGCYRGSKIQSLTAGLAFHWYQRFLNKVDAFVALSEHQYQTLSSLVPTEKLKLKPNAVSVPNQKPCVDKSGYVFVGRLESGKGIEVLLESFSTLGADFDLTVIGDGPLYETLVKRYESKHIRFLGTQPPSVVEASLRAAKYCVHPSLYYETFGLTLVQAYAQATPVIGFHIGTRVELIDDNVTGFLCEPDTLAQTIRQAQVFDGYERMCEKAFEKAQEFSSKAVTEKQVHLYESLLEHA